MMLTMLAFGMSSVTRQVATKVESSSRFHWKGMSNFTFTLPSAKYCRTGTPPKAAELSDALSEDVQFTVFILGIEFPTGFVYRQLGQTRADTFHP
jgi:hypothetical protein